MAPPKKMTLQEFFTDESFGGSWADDDIDIASISVPIEKHKNYMDSHRHHGNFGYGGGSYINGIKDYGPPYIVKLSNIPLSADDFFVEDLFKSRYTSFVKFKILVDPSSNVLETKIVKKVVFVELHNFQDMAKAVKWLDLYYSDRRRVTIEKAEFSDFQNCLQFNQQHEAEIQNIVNDALKGRLNGPRKHTEGLDAKSHKPNMTRQQNVPIAKTPVVAPKKPNPFGSAKPVDVLAKQQEIEKKLITINHTTIKTIGDIEETNDSPSVAPKVSVLKKSPGKPQDTPEGAEKHQRSSVSAGSNAHNEKPLSLAEQLSSKNINEKINTASSNKNSHSKASSNKQQVILKKKPTVVVGNIEHIDDPENTQQERKEESRKDQIYTPKSDPITSGESNSSNIETGKTETKIDNDNVNTIANINANGNEKAANHTAHTKEGFKLQEFHLHGHTNKTKDELAMILEKTKLSGKKAEDPKANIMTIGPDDDKSSKNHYENEKRIPTNELDTYSRGKLRGRGRGGSRGTSRGVNRGRGRNVKSGYRGGRRLSNEFHNNEKIQNDNDDVNTTNIKDTTRKITSKEESKDKVPQSEYSETNEAKNTTASYSQPDIQNSNEFSKHTEKRNHNTDNKEYTSHHSSDEIIKKEIPNNEDAEKSTFSSRERGNRGRGNRGRGSRGRGIGARGVGERGRGSRGTMSIRGNRGRGRDVLDRETYDSNCNKDIPSEKKTGY